MSIQKNPTAPTNETETVAVMVDEEMIKKAWGFDANHDTYFYMVLGAAYCASFLPSASGIFIIGPSRAVLIWYLTYDAVIRFLDIDKKP